MSTTWREQSPDTSIADALRAVPSAPQPNRSDSREQLVAKAAFAALTGDSGFKTEPFVPSNGGLYVASGQFTVETPPVDAGPIAFLIAAVGGGTAIQGPWGQEMSAGQIFFVFNDGTQWSYLEWITS